MYPKASGNGIMANNLMYEICKMAGLHDIGIKVHGSRNVRNAGERRSWSARGSGGARRPAAPEAAGGRAAGQHPLVACPGAVASAALGR
jgi:hypothetical protein